MGELCDIFHEKGLGNGGGIPELRGLPISKVESTCPQLLERIPDKKNHVGFAV